MIKSFKNAIVLTTALLLALLLGPQEAWPDHGKPKRPEGVNGLIVSVTAVANTKHTKYTKEEDYPKLLLSNLEVSVELKNVSSRNIAVIYPPSPERSVSVLLGHNKRLLCDYKQILGSTDYQVEREYATLKPGQVLAFKETIFAIKQKPSKGKYFVIVHYKGAPDDWELINYSPRVKGGKRVKPAIDPTAMWSGPEVRSKPFPVTLR